MDLVKLLELEDFRQRLQVILIKLNPNQPQVKDVKFIHLQLTDEIEYL
jgi:hypothetical protein